MNHWLKNCYFYFIIYSLQPNKLCSSKNWNVVYNQVNLWFCVTLVKIIHLFCKIAAEGVHWNNTQATIPQFVIYFKNLDAFNTEHENLLMISDCEKHASIFVRTFQRYLLKLTEKTF